MVIIIRNSNSFIYREYTKCILLEEHKIIFKCFKCCYFSIIRVHIYIISCSKNSPRIN
nr:MAG TPA: hypothetical protein [Caudoviricetes sp.]